ncbi:MAG: hypothetical protein AAF554_07535 [Bacteroidota bacterium]
MELVNDSFDNWVKSQVDEVQEPQDIFFAEEKVWKKIERGLPPSGRFSKKIWMGILVLGLLGTIPWFLQQSSTNEPTSENQRTLQKKLMIEPKGLVFDANRLRPKGGLPNKRVSSVPMVNTHQLPKVSESFSAPLVAGDSLVSKMGNEKIPLGHTIERTSVHVYRPNRYVGSALVFKLKANGSVVEKVKNGSYSNLELPTGVTYFTVGKQTLRIDLEPVKTYYLRVAYKGFPLGKLHLDWIEASAALKEISNDGIKSK